MVKVVDQVAPEKRKRFNKNKKKAWRKKANITVAEEHLEEIRREERYGGPLEEKEDKELMFLDLGNEVQTRSTKKESKKAVYLEYTVDKIPADSISKKKKKATGTLKPSFRTQKVKTLKSHALLNGLPGAKRPHKLRPKQEEPTAAMKKKAKVLEKDPKLKRKAEAVLNAQVDYKKKKIANQRNIVRNNYSYNVWDQAANTKKECEKKGVDPSFQDDIANFYTTVRNLRPVNVPAVRFQPTSTLATVQAPAGGQSYNPSYEDHQRIMKRAAKQETRKLKSKEYTRKLATKGFPTADKAPNEATWLNEMSEGLPHTQDGQEGEEEVDNETVTTTSKPKPERKTKQKRKRELKQKLAKIRKVEEKVERMRSSDVFRIKALNKEIDEIDAVNNQRVLSRKAHRKKLLTRPHRLSKLCFKPEDIAVQLGDQLPGSLREAVPAVPLITERFKHYQRRNLVEVRLRRKIKSRKPKLQVKRTHREALKEIEKRTAVDSE